MNAYVAGLGLALLSHLLAATIPTLLKPLIIEAGPGGGGCIMYLYSFVILALRSQLSVKVHNQTVQASQVFDKQNRSRYLWTFMLGLHAASAMVFFVGLSYSANPTIFGAVSKLDGVLPFLFAILFLGERPSRIVFVGAPIAFIGGAFVIGYGNLEVRAVIAAALFALLSAAAIVTTKEVLNRRVASAEGVLFYRQGTVLSVVGLVFVATSTSQQFSNFFNEVISWRGLFAGVALTGLFLCRFQAIARIPLWQYSVLGALQPILMAVVGVIAGESIPPELWGALTIVTIGEFISFLGERPKEVQP